VITGASSGLNKATARLLSSQGASIVPGAWCVDRLTLLAAELFARAVAFAMSQPDDMDVNEIP
jgi:NADP-dependent 3-hydroxy acid dehydrogenase YdfG